MAGGKKLLLLPSVLVRAGWEAVEARPDIEARAYDVNIAPADLHRLLAEAEGIGLGGATRFGSDELAAAPRLRAVARHGVGYDQVDVAALTRRGLPLLITGCANSPSVAEHALYFMLELAKRGAAFDAMVREQRWGERLKTDLPLDLFGKTLLIVGFGRIGTRLARVALALGMRVQVNDPYVDATVIGAAGCTAAPDLDAALAEADFVSIHCPKSAATTRLFDAARLARMRPSAFLVNTARGGIVDEAALLDALLRGAIRGAGLDVYEQEPTPAANALPRLPNVVSAPHMAGVTVEAMRRMGISMVDNLLSVLDRRPNVDNVVNREVFAKA